MREYSDIISVNKNSRGVYVLDTSIGCQSGMTETENGCYGDCYSAKAAKRYGYDFSKTVLRHFENRAHERQVVQQLSKISMPFIRIGGSGDPSENWGHAISIIKVIARCNKQIVIITRHWTVLTDEHLRYFSGLNICINTSVSALDTPTMRDKSIEQYNRIKTYCKSILRIVSCDFNLDNVVGHNLAKIQADLFLNEDTLDTVFRPDKNSHWVTSGIINVKKARFSGNTKQLVSKFNKKTYLGKCSTCHQMCGVTMLNTSHNYTPDNPIVHQQSLF